MTKLIPANGSPVVVVNLANSCGKYGLLLQNLSNIPVEFSESATDLSPQANDAKLGFTLIDNSAIIILSPYSGTLYAHVNVIGADAKIAVHQFARS